ncbi:hypothetical protein ACWCXH_39545 [Kitasatospora sp. NPDC001660]
MTDHHDQAAALPGTPEYWREWALNAAHLLELTEEFFSRAGEDVHRTLAGFLTARGERPATAPGGFTDALGITALAIRDDLTAGGAR